jgi:hypothetical protein
VVDLVISRLLYPRDDIRVAHVLARSDREVEVSLTSRTVPLPGWSATDTGFSNYARYPELGN